MSTAITGSRFLDALEQAGVIHPGDKVRRVIIDAPYGGILTIYIERVGDDRVLEVVQHPDLKIARVDRGE